MGDIEMNHTTNVMYFKMEKIDPPNDLLDENYTQIGIMQTRQWRIKSHKREHNVVMPVPLFHWFNQYVCCNAVNSWILPFGGVENEVMKRIRL